MALTVKPLNEVRKSIPIEKVATPSPEELVRVNLQVDKETRIRWHTAAMQQGISLKELIQRSVDSYIKQ